MYLARKFLTTTYVCDNPLINPGCIGKIGRALLSWYQLPNNIAGMGVDSEQKGDLFIRYFWVRVPDYILEIQVINTDDASYMTKTLDKILVTAERVKKRKYLDG